MKTTALVIIAMFVMVFATGCGNGESGAPTGINPEGLKSNGTQTKMKTQKVSGMFNQNPDTQ